MDTITFTVPGMTCGHCVAAVSEELAKVSGVADSSIDLDTKTVIVTGEHIDRSDLDAAIDEAGFEIAWP